MARVLQSIKHVQSLSGCSSRRSDYSPGDESTNWVTLRILCRKILVGGNGKAV